jgi:uncharacterized YccA/Bax inhibitor family protein
MKFFEAVAKVLAGFALILAPIHPIILSVGVLIFADVFFGIWAARKRGEKITSKRMSDSVVKMLVYQTVLITGFLVETHLISGAVPVVKLAAGYIGMVELKSLLENSSAILGRDIFKEIIAALASKSEKTKDHSKE